jgi:hypothetical protein
LAHVAWSNAHDVSVDASAGSMESNGSQKTTWKVPPRRIFADGEL